MGINPLWLAHVVWVFFFLGSLDSKLGFVISIFKSTQFIYMAKAR